jgi:hypothetical protein
MLRLRAVLCSVALVAAQQTPPPRVTPSPGEIPHIVACDKDGLFGDHIHIFGTTADLGQWDNRMSSRVLLRGQGECVDEDHVKSTKMGEFGPGVYLRVYNHGLKAKSLASIRLVSPMGRKRALAGLGSTGASCQGIVQREQRRGGPGGTACSTPPRMLRVLRSSRRTHHDYADYLGEIAGRLLAGV